ncbi:heat shock factor protein 5 [Aquarana catesbeiana]|uniref:heat shock factor protein 5 n=1 Tax=Aquarana catesbeiana TaxID=8400 RepID=UPI003CC9390E
MHPHSFPAKLWRIVNDPRYRSMRWDPRGEGIVIDQEFFEAEILVRRGIFVPKDMFKVSSFGSFIRQLNLYGFRKLGFASGDSGHHVGNLGDGARSLHHFCNASFHRDHPELLFNLKRLTNVNKAKMAARFKGNARPQNRYLRILPNQVEEQRGAKSQGLMPLEKNKHFPKQENISLYPYAGPVSQSHSASSIKEFVDMPVSTKMLPSSVGPHQGYLSVPSPFPERPALFPLIQQVPTQVAYTLQSTATSLHVQQGHSVMMGSVQNYGSSLSMQYPSAYYPADHIIIPITQRPLMQPPCPMEVFHPYLPNTNCADFSRAQVNLDTAVQVVDDLQASHQPEMAQLDVQENRKELLSSSNDGHVPETFEHSQTQQLECLLPVNMDITNCAAKSFQVAPFLHTQASECISFKQYH